VSVVFALRPLDGSDERLAVRQLTRTALAERLGLDPERLDVGADGRMPTLQVDGRVANATLSLSHHGRFVAFACRLPELGRLS
jgi:hypothetical protein